MTIQVGRKWVAHLWHWGCFSRPLAHVLTPPQGYNGEEQFILWSEVRATLRVPLSLSWALGQSESPALLESETGSWRGKVGAGGPRTTRGQSEAGRGWEVSSGRSRSCWLRPSGDMGSVSRDSCPSDPGPLVFQENPETRFVGRVFQFQNVNS